MKKCKVNDWLLIVANRQLELSDRSVLFPLLYRSGPVLALALTRDDAIQHWRGLLGPKVLDEAKERFPER